MVRFLGVEVGEEIIDRQGERSTFASVEGENTAREEQEVEIFLLSCDGGTCGFDVLEERDVAGDECAGSVCIDVAVYVVDDGFGGIFVAWVGSAFLQT